MANFSKSFNFRNGVQVDNDKFIVKPSGLVGIGSTLPSQSLDVIGNVETTGVSSASNVFAGVGLTIGTGLKQINLDGATGIITAANFFGDGSTLTNIVAIATAGFEERSGTLSTTFSVGIGSLNVGAGGSFPDFTLDVLGDMRVTGPSTFVGLTTVQGDVFVTQLSVSGISTLKSGLIINEGGATIDQTNVTGVSTFGGVVDINAGLDVDGQADLDEVVVAGVSTFSALVDVNNRLDVVGGANIDQVNVSGVSTFGGAIDANAGADISGGEAVLSSATVSDLTDNRIVIAGTSGALEDSGNLIFTGTQFTVTGDATISGVSTLSGNLQVGSGATVGFAKSLSMSDGAHVNFGDQDDLVIRHTGSRSEILERGTGGLKIFTDDLEFANASGLSTSMKVHMGSAPDGELRLFRDGNQKFNITGAGASVLNTLSVAVHNGGTGGLSTHTGTLSYGEVLAAYSGRRSLDLANKDTGNLNFYLNLDDITFNSVNRTGDFNWIKGSSAAPSMTLTGIGGSLGIGVTLPTVQLETSLDVKIGQNLTVTDDITVTSGNLIITSGTFSGSVTGPLSGDVNSTGISTFTDLTSSSTILTGVSTISRIALNTTEMITVKPVGASISQDTMFNALAGGNNYYLSNNGFVGIRTSDRFSNIVFNGSNANAVFQSFGVGSYEHFQSTHLQAGAVDFANAGIATQRYMVPPKVTTTQRNAFSGLVEGAMIYNTSSNRLEVYTQNSDWVGIATTP